MRIASKLTLLGAAALMAMAFTPASASATAPVEVIDEFTGDPCNPCEIHAVGELVMRHESFGIRLSTCEEELEGEISHDGTGAIHVLNNEDHDGFTCRTQNCNGVGEPPTEAEWPIFSTEETGPHEAAMNLRFCLDQQSDPDVTGDHCVTTAHLAQPVEGSHQYALSINDQHCVGSTNTVVNATWEIEVPDACPHAAIEVVHL